MNRKAQVVIISLWVVIILAILAVGLGHSVSLALRLSKYQIDRLKTYYLSKEGINKAIVEIRKDAPAYDSLKDKWAQDQFAVTDEERKVNINTASQELLFSLFEAYGATNALQIVDNLRAWRGDVDIPIPDYQELGYTNKADKFSNIEELMLVKDVNTDIYAQIKEEVTAFGSGKINLNTASKTVLGVLIQSCVKKLEKEGVSERQPEDLLMRILQLRQNGVVLESMADLRAKLDSASQRNILNKMEEEADTKSTCFYILSNGKIDRQSQGATISCVFDRGSEKIVYWHES